MLLAKREKKYLEMLILRFRVFVKRLTYSYELPSFNSEDFMQEGLIALCNAVTTYDSEKHVKFSTYAAACIKNRIKDIFKAAGREKRKAVTISLDAQINAEEQRGYCYETVASDTLSPEDKLMEAEIHREREETLKKHLSDMEFKVLMLRLEGMSYEEIAVELNNTFGRAVSSKTVDNAMQRVRSKLISWREGM